MHISQDGLLLLQRHELDELYVNTVLLLYAGNASMQVARQDALLNCSRCGAEGLSTLSDVLMYDMASYIWSLSLQQNLP